VSRRASPRLVIYAALAAAGLLAALASGRTELVVLAAPFAVFVPVALALAREPRVEFSFTLSEDRAIEGDHLEATLELRAGAPIERFDMLVEIPPALAPDPVPRALALRLAPGRPHRVRFALAAGRWGAYELGAVAFRAHDRFGLVSWEGRAECGVALRVYPQLEPLRRLATPLRTRPFPGTQIARARGEGIEFADIRPFQHGDHPRRVNWRATARAGTLLLTEQRPERTSDVVLLLDGYADIRHGRSGTLDALVRAAASLAAAHLARRDRVGVVSFGSEVSWLDPQSGDRQLYRIVESLIETEVVRSYRWHQVDRLPPRTLPPGALVIALTPLAERRIVAALFDLRARGFDVVVVEVSPLPHIAAPADVPAALARRLWLLSRDALRFALERAGIPVASLEDARELPDAIEEVRAFRRFALRTRAS
jgi:uncharacterized protein (DUF58 family)